MPAHPKTESPLAKLRRKKLRLWIDENFNGVVLQFALHVNKPQPQIQDMLDGRKSFGEKIAATLESSCKAMPKGYLVNPDGQTSSSGRMKIWDLHLSAEEAELGAEWGKIDGPLRETLKSQIYIAVAKQMRAAHDGNKSTKRKPPKLPPPDRPTRQ